MSPSETEQDRALAMIMTIYELLKQEHLHPAAAERQYLAALRRVHDYWQEQAMPDTIKEDQKPGNGGL